MNYKTVCALEKFTEKLEFINFCIMMIACAIVFGPFYGLFKLWMYCKDRVRDFRERFANPEEYKMKAELEEAARKIMDREMAMADCPMVLGEYRKRFDKGNEVLFHQKRKYRMPFSSVVYVESEYNERLHEFFEQRKNLIDEWCAWHGWTIEFVDKETVKEGMMLPEEYERKFNHGFLWYQQTSIGFCRYSIHGDIHIYYEIDPTASDDDILKQMNLMMSKVYSKFEWMMV